MTTRLVIIITIENAKLSTATLYANAERRNGTVLFRKCKLLFEYQHYSYLETSGGQSSNLYLNVVHFFNTSVN